MNIKEISIIIPAYNEEKILLGALATIKNFCDTNFKKYEIILVDDGSKDQTVNIAKSTHKNYFNNNSNLIVLENLKNMGKGYSVKRGMLQAKYNYALFTDADQSTPIHELLKFDEYCEDYDIIIGSRNKQDSNLVIKQPWTRRMMGRTFSLICNLILGLHLEDTQCGFKMFKKEHIKNIFDKQTINRFSFDVEILYITKKLNLTVLEKGITWIDNNDSRVSPIKDSIEMLKQMLLIRWKHRK